jgi:hypothetical protein
MDFWRWYNNITITILDIIYRSVSYLKHSVSGTEFCFRHQLDQMDEARLSPNSWNQRRNVREILHYKWYPPGWPNHLRHASDLRQTVATRAERNNRHQPSMRLCGIRSRTTGSTFYLIYHIFYYSSGYFYFYFYFRDSKSPNREHVKWRKRKESE